MVFAVVSVWCYSHYQLTRARHEEILAELELRRGREPVEEDEVAASTVLRPGPVVP
jgi:Na+/melibiose symporter-like transporter